MMHVPYYSPLYLVTDKIKKSNNSLLKITAFVACIHFLLIGISIFIPFSSPQPKLESNPKVIVKTISLQPKIQELNPITDPVAKPIETLIKKDDLVMLEKASPDPIIQEPIKQVEPPKIEIESKPITPKPIEKSTIPEKTEQPKTSTPNQNNQKSAIKNSSSSPKEKPKIKDEKKAQPKSIVDNSKKLPDKASIEKAQPKKNTAPVKNTTESSNLKDEKIKKAQEAKALEDRLKAEEKAKQQKLIDEQFRQKLAKAQENLTKVKNTSETIKSSSSTTDIANLPKEFNLEIETLPIGATIAVELSTKELNYRDEISIRVKKELSLPEHGSGTIRLTVNRTGKVDNVEVLKSESVKNKEYIQQKLPSLRFPPFENRFIGSTQYTFILKF